MSHTDSDPDAVDVPVSSFLPDHLVGGDPSSVESVSTTGAEQSDEEEDEEADDIASEFCQSWQQHLSGGSTPF